MSSTATATRKNPKKAPTRDSAPAAPTPHKPILGVDVKGELLDVSLDRIVDPGGQADRMPRPGDEQAVAQLARSMAECGQLQPVMLEALADGRYCRVFGRRRIAAARALGWTTVRAAVVPPLADDVRRTVVAVENVQRQDLTPAEETLAVDELMLLQAIPAARQLGKPLLDGCGSWSGRTASEATSFDGADARAREALSHDALLDHRVRRIAAELVSAMLGKSVSWVLDRLYIGRLGPKAKRMVLDGKLPLAHAREISRVGDPKQRDRLAQDYAAGGDDSISDTEAGRLEDLQEEVRRSVFALHVVPWRLHAAFAGRRACEGCPHNSATHPGLFDPGSAAGAGEASLAMIGGRGTYQSVSADDPRAAAAGVCTMPSCYADKLRAAKAAISAAAKRIVDGKGKGKPAAAPEYVAPAALERKVAERRKLRGSGKGSRAGSAPAAPTPKQLESQARRDAEQKWREEMRQRAEQIQKQIAAKAAAKPGLWSLLSIILEGRTCQATRSNDTAKAARAVSGPNMAALLRLLAKPDWDAIVKAERDCGRRYSILQSWYDGPSGLADAVAKAMGIELDAPPTVESFLPKAMTGAGGSAASGTSSRARGRKPGGAAGSGSRPGAKGRKPKSDDEDADGDDE